MSAKNKNQPLQHPHNSPSPKNSNNSGSSAQATPLNEPTKRTFGQVQNVVGQNFYQKQTERNYNRSGKMMIWLTQSEGSEKNSEGDWSIHNDSPARQERINEICHIMEERGLMKAFQAFNELRELIANDLLHSQAEGSHKFRLIEGIERFSNRFNMIRNLFYSQQSNKKYEYKEFKGYLQEITFLRAQNAKLKNKIINFSSKRQKNEYKLDEMDNSLLNNSISFHSYTSGDSAYKSDQSFQVRLDKEFVKPFVIVKEPFCDEQSTLGVFSESIEVERKHSQNNYVAEADSILIGMENKETQTDSFQNKQDHLKMLYFGKSISIKCLSALKLMLKLCVQSVNQAVIRKPKSLQLLSQLVEKITTFRPSTSNEYQDNFYPKMIQTIDFSILMNHSLRKLLYNEKQPHSHTANKENMQFQ